MVSVTTQFPMKSSALSLARVSSLLALLAVLSSPTLIAATSDHQAMAGMDHPVPSEHKAWLDKAKAVYPLQTCVVSGDKLEDGSMGAPVDYIHKEEGKPDRLVRFCCKSCIKTFKKTPAKYLKLIDEAASATPKA